MITSLPNLHNSKPFVSPSLTFIARSTLPVGAGLGSSTAFCTCVATSLLLVTRRISIPAPYSMNTKSVSILNRYRISTAVAEELQRWASIAEKIVHKRMNKTDTKLAIAGGVWERTRFYQNGAAEYAIRRCVLQHAHSQE